MIQSVLDYGVKEYRMEALTIGALAKEAGVHVETIRYYQRRGLLDEPARASGSIRRYGPATAARIAFIKRAQDIGFSLDEIKELLRLERTPGCRDARDIAEKKLAIIRTRVTDLQRVSRVLAKLIAECDAGRERDCPIIDCLAGTPGGHDATVKSRGSVGGAQIE